MVKHSLLSETSLFPTSKDIIWSKLQEIKTLQHISAPFATFTPLENSTDLIWREGEVFQFRFKLFGILPFGVHTIRVIRFSEATHEVYTEECNPHVPTWNHKIYLRAIDKQTTQYTDEIEIFAGRKTVFVTHWARAFYRHRQKKWIKLLKAYQ